MNLPGRILTERPISPSIQALSIYLELLSIRDESYI
jgi:hypothetical protein